MPNHSCTVTSKRQRPYHHHRVRNRRYHEARFLVVAMLLLVALYLVNVAHGLVVADSIRCMSNNAKQRGKLSCNYYISRTAATKRLLASSSSSEDDEMAEEQDFGEDDLQTAGVMIDDLNWRVAKLRLEEANKRRFLKAKPRFLPYKDACDWVQAWGQRWTTAEDWEDWISMGEKRNSYIPSRPEEYYTRTGDWISWDHFLGVDSKKEESNESADSDSNT